jgi:hypothetical protein
MGPTQKTGFGAGARIGTIENINKNNFQKRKAEKDRLTIQIWIIVYELRLCVKLPHNLVFLMRLTNSVGSSFDFWH